MTYKLHINTLAICLMLFCNIICFAKTDKYRLVVNDDPTTDITIVFNAIDGLNHKVFYDTVDNGTDITAYSNVATISHSFDNFRGMNTKFVKLSNLQPKTTYYFVVSDNNSVSRRFYFTTASNNPADPISLIMGGDSRNNREPRRNANKLVAKIRPDVVTFAGDMTDLATSDQWIEWFDDWQETIAPDGRMTPVIVAEGNHEKNIFSSVSYIERFFGAPSTGYYAIEYNTLLKIFTLNTEISISGDQTTWLTNELQTSWDKTWKVAQYHKPMRPHSSSKADGVLQYDNWANLFYNYNVRLVQESDIHLCKATWPIRPTNSNEYGSDEGFVKDCNGTVFTGSGAWGAPLRQPDDLKDWTRDAEGVNHFQWAIISQDKIDVRTVLTDYADEVCFKADNAPADEIPTNIKFWNPSNGELIRINNPNYTPYLANFKADILEGNAPLTVNFEGFFSGCANYITPPKYYWNFNDGTTALNTQTAKHTFTNPGTYEVFMQMEINGDRYTKTTTITVNDPNCIVDPIIINEIKFAPDTTNNTGDYIEIYNPNSFDVDLSCYSIITNNHNFILDNVYIPSNSYYIVAQNPELLSQVFPNATNISSYSGIDLGDTTDKIELFNEQGCLVDIVQYSTSSPWPTSTTAYTLHLLNPALDNSLGQSWAVIDVGTPSFQNYPIQATVTFVKAFLEGPYDPNTGLMKTNLQSNNLLPFSQPFSTTNHSYFGNETATNFSSDITDWVYLELRDKSNPAILVDTRAALIKNDGTILDINGQEGVTFYNAPPDDYYIVIYHKAHLGVMSSSTITLPNAALAPYDFTTSVSQASGLQQQMLLGNGKAALHCGDFDGSGIINNIDYNFWGSASSVINQYVPWDSDLNTLVNNLDYNNWDRNKSKVGILYIQK